MSIRIVDYDEKSHALFYIQAYAYLSNKLNGFTFTSGLRGAKFYSTKYITRREYSRELRLAETN